MVSSYYEKRYKLVSSTATAIETIITPLVSKSYSLMFEGSTTTRAKVNSCLTPSNSCTSSLFCCFFPLLRTIHNSINSPLQFSISNNYSDLLHTLSIITKGLNTRQKEFEDYFNSTDSSVSRNWVFSLENRELIRQIANYLSDNLKDLKNFPYYLIIRYFRAYSKLQKLARRHKKIQKLPLNDHLMHGLQNLDRFSIYASGIYGSQLPKGLTEEEKQAILKEKPIRARFQMFCEVEDKDLLLFEDKAQKYLPAHALILNHELKAVVLVIRGTVEKFDIIADLDGDELRHEIKDCKTGQVLRNGLVHKGMYQCALNLSSKLRNEVLRVANEHQGYSVYISGHSLGAGTAALLALIWINDPDFTDKGLLALCYAPPPLISPELNEVLKQKVFSVAFGDDAVTRLSEGSLKDLGQVLKFFSKHDEMGSKYSNIKTKTVLSESEEEKIYVSAYNDLTSTLNNYKLETPGNLLQVYQKSIHLNYPSLSSSSSEYAGSFVPSSFCDSLIFTKTVINDHNTLNYINGPKSYLLEVSQDS